MSTFPYEAVYRALPADDGGGFMAFYPTLGEYTIYGQGDSINEAIAALADARESVFAFWAEKGIAIPAPTARDLDVTGAQGDCLASYGYAA